MSGRAESRVLSLLGIARRAGRLAVGTHAVTMAAKSGRLGVLIVASDASDGDQFGNALAINTSGLSSQVTISIFSCSPISLTTALTRVP